MKTPFKTLAIVVTLGIMMLSCSSNDDDVIALEDDSEETCSNSSVFNTSFTGTVCCTQRNSDLTIGDTVEYEYFTNLSDPDISWEVSSGDIEIISGRNSNVVKIKLGDSFTEGKLYVLGSGICVGSEDIECVCGHPISIVKTKK